MVDSGYFGLSSLLDIDDEAVAQHLGRTEVRCVYHLSMIGCLASVGTYLGSLKSLGESDFEHSSLVQVVFGSGLELIQAARLV